jgi:hypothetical protein
MGGLRNIGANMSRLLRGKLPFVYRFVQSDLGNILSIHHIYSVLSVSFSYANFQSSPTKLGGEN